MKSNVRGYTTEEILKRVKALPSFRQIPFGYWIVGISSIEDEPDSFDDKFYLFHHKTFICVTTGTTNPGKYGLLNYKEWNKQGCAVMKVNEWYYDLWAPGLHKGKMRALVQINNAKYYRDNDNDHKSEEIGEVYEGIIGLNFHTVSYDTKPNFIQVFIAWLIGKWSVGCQVANNMNDYYRILGKIGTQKTVSYCLLKED